MPNETIIKHARRTTSIVRHVGTQKVQTPNHTPVQGESETMVLSETYDKVAAGTVCVCLCATAHTQRHV